MHMQLVDIQTKRAGIRTFRRLRTGNLLSAGQRPRHLRTNDLHLLKLVPVSFNRAIDYTVFTVYIAKWEVQSYGNKSNEL